MASREASLRLRWDQSSFSSQVKQSADNTRKQFAAASTDIGASLKRGIGSGFDAAKRSLSGFGGSIKSVLGTMATLGGAVSFGEFARRAIEAEEQAGGIAVQLRRMGVEGANTADVLALSVAKARELNLATSEVTASYSALIAETRNPVFAQSALASVEQFQHAFRLANGEATGLVTALIGGLHASTEQLRDEFGPAIRDAISQGGMTEKDIAAMAPQLIKTMTTIGSQGGKGFVELVGLINMTEDSLGGVEAALPGVAKMLLALRTPNLGKKIAADFKLDKDASGADNLQKMMGAKGGLEALEKAFGKSQRTAGAFNALMMGFEEAQKAAIAAGMKPAEARKVAGEKFAQELARMTAVTSTAADVDRDAAAKVAEKGEQFKRALDRMAATFTKPAMLNAMDKLAEKLPLLADAFETAVGFITKHPALSAAIAVGGPAAASGAASMAGSLLKSWLLTGGKGVAGAAAGALGGGAMNVSVLNVGMLNNGPAGAAATAAATTTRAATVAAATWRDTARQVGLNFSTVVGAAAAAWAGWEIGSKISEEIVAPAMSADIGAQGQYRTSLVKDDAERVQRSGTAAETAEALQKVKAERKTIREGSGYTDVFGTAASMFTGTAAPPAIRAEREASLIAVQADLELSLRRRIATEERLAKASIELAKAKELETKATRGVRRPAAPMPGTGS